MIHPRRFLHLLQYLTEPREKPLLEQSEDADNRWNCQNCQSSVRLPNPSAACLKFGGTARRGSIFLLCASTGQKSWGGNPVNQAANVLIADDEELFRESIKGFLSAKGYACTCVGNAPEASRLITEQPYDLLISNIVMPGNSDLQLVLEVEKKTPWIPIILVTGHPSGGNGGQGRAASGLFLPAAQAGRIQRDSAAGQQFVARGRLLRIITSVRRA